MGSPAEFSLVEIFIYFALAFIAWLAFDVVYQQWRLKRRLRLPKTPDPPPPVPGQASQFAQGVGEPVPLPRFHCACRLDAVLFDPVWRFSRTRWSHQSAPLVSEDMDFECRSCKRVWTRAEIVEESEKEN